MREGASWKNKRSVGDLWDTRNQGGVTKDLEMTIRVACVVGKPTGLVYSPFHYLPPAQPWTTFFLLGKVGIEMGKRRKKRNIPIIYSMLQGLHFPLLLYSLRFCEVRRYYRPDFVAGYSEVHRTVGRIE